MQDLTGVHNVLMPGYDVSMRLTLHAADGNCSGDSDALRDSAVYLEYKL